VTASGPTRAAAAALLLLAGCPALDPMQRQQKVRAYEESAYYPDGLAMRDPPAGTVPYASVVPADLGRGVGPDGKPVARVPIELTGDLLALGRKRFEITCAVCHGVLGDGESQVALNMSLRKPPSLHAYRDVPDGYLFQVVTNGFGLMPSYATQLTIRERWAVVAYVRALQLSQAASLAEAPPDVRGQLEKEKR
jgi:mono/diheme cytochrome c family protein